MLQNPQNSSILGSHVTYYLPQKVEITMLLKLLLNGDIRLFVSKFVSYPLLPTVYCPTCTPLQILSLPLLLKLVYSSAQKKMVRTKIGPSVHLKPLWVRRNHVISFCA